MDKHSQCCLILYCHKCIRCAEYISAFIFSLRIRLQDNYVLKTDFSEKFSVWQHFQNNPRSWIRENN